MMGYHWSEIYKNKRVHELLQMSDVVHYLTHPKSQIRKKAYELILESTSSTDFIDEFKKDSGKITQALIEEARADTENSDAAFSILVNYSATCKNILSSNSEVQAILDYFFSQCTAFESKRVELILNLGKRC